MPRLFPPEYHKFAPVSINVTLGKRSRTMPALPSREPLSTTMISWGKSRLVRSSDSRQRASSSRVL